MPIERTFTKESEMYKSLVYCTAMMLAVTLPAAEANLAPMLDAGVTVPNGGILRLFLNASMKDRKNLAAVFDESPYKDVQPPPHMQARPSVTRERSFTHCWSSVPA